MGDLEVTKLQKHLTLLRQEYVKLQSKCLQLERQLAVSNAASGQIGEDTYISQLLKVSRSLFEKEIYSDITIKYGNKSIRLHKIILAARSNCWTTNQELSDIDELTFEGISLEVGNTLVKWLYTDEADIKNDESFIMDLVRAANKYKLKSLRDRCEQMLMSAVSVSNCIRFYQTAEDIGAEALRKYCSEIIANHWDDLETEDFAGMSAPLLYDMFKAKSSFPLHFAIRHHREDVVFLYLIENNLSIPAKLNEFEPQTGMLPLQIALNERQDSIAKTLVLHNCDVNMPDTEGMTLLHRFISEGNCYAAQFLIENGAEVTAETKETRENPLHLAAKYNCGIVNLVALKEAYKKRQRPMTAKHSSLEEMAGVARSLLDGGCNANAKDSQGRTALHLAVSFYNEEVFTLLLADKTVDLEAQDNSGNVVLWFAITNTQIPLERDADGRSFAARLIKQGSNPSSHNPNTGDSLLHLAAQTNNESASLFLVDHGALLDHANKLGETPLHVASHNGLPGMVNKLLKSGANPNDVTSENEVLKTKDAARQSEFQRKCQEARHRIIMLEKSKATKRANKLRAIEREKENAKEKEKEKEYNAQPETTTSNPFDEPGNPFQDDTPTNPFEEEDNPFLNDDDDDDLNPFNDDESGSSFLNEMQAASSAAMALTSGFVGHSTVTRASGGGTRERITTFDGRIDVQSIQSPTQVDSFDFDHMQISQLDVEDGLHDDVITECWHQTPLHMAVSMRHENVVQAFVNHSENASLSGGRLPMLPDFNVRDSAGQTPLLLALLTGQYVVAQRLIDADADVNSRDGDDHTLLQLMIMRRDAEACLFLLNNGADLNIRSRENMSPLQMAIHARLTPVVDALCAAGAEVNNSDENGNTALWVAMRSQQHDIAASLVKHGADTDSWNTGVNGCVWSLLHRAIYENDETTACFLIQNKCDIQSARRPGMDGGSMGNEGIDGMTPLHMSCAAGQDKIVQCLLENNADINVQDGDGRSPIHIAITTKNPIINKILLSHPEVNFTLKDKQGQTPFVIAMLCRDNEASSAILAREPSAAEQFNNKGQNYLHEAILRKCVDDVLFLISIEVDVNSPVQDGSQRSPLHLAVPNGNEIIVRHLILAGANVNAIDRNRQTALHCAAIEDKPSIVSVLLQSNALPDTVDSNLNNALHLACQHGNLASVRTLLTESQINAEAFNRKAQNPLHVLASQARDNAAAIFELFKQTMPDYPFDDLDGDESTALFIAYTVGAVGLCCSLMRVGARLGTMNKHGYSVFNAPVATKKLLFKLLDLLNAEPAWSDGPNCHECGEKFGLTTRKHHCRHCGRLLCNKCSIKQLPILKYEITKPVRVCEVCFQFLTT